MGEKLEVFIFKWKENCHCSEIYNRNIITHSWARMATGFVFMAYSSDESGL